MGDTSTLDCRFSQPSMLRHYMLCQLDEMYAEAWTEPEIHQISNPGELPVTYIRRLLVPVRHRHRGYGKAVLEHVVRDADRLGHMLTIDCSPDNPRDYVWIYDMYISFGFVDIENFDEILRPRDLIRLPRESRYKKADGVLV